MAKRAAPTPSKDDPVVLGDPCRDIVTGFSGIAVAIVQHINGCDRIMIEPPLDKDGKVPKLYSFDANRVVREPGENVMAKMRKIAPEGVAEKPGPTRDASERKIVER